MDKKSLLSTIQFVYDDSGEIIGSVGRVSDYGADALPTVLAPGDLWLAVAIGTKRDGLFYTKEEAVQYVNSAWRTTT